MDIFDVILPNCPPRSYSVSIFNKNVLQMRVASIKKYLDKYTRAMDLFYLKFLMRIMKFTCEDLQLDLSDISASETQIIINDLLELAAMIVYCSDKSELRMADKIIKRLMLI